MKKCPLCGSVRSRLMFPTSQSVRQVPESLFSCTSTGYTIHGPIYRCSSCSLAYISDQTSVGQIIRQYKVVDDPIYVAEAAARVKTFHRHLGSLEPFKGKRLLDVGAYTGLFVSLARNKYHINLTLGVLRPGYFKPASFEVITLWDVVEHFPDPKRAMQICYAYLKRGGWIAMSTINIDSLIARLLGRRWPWLMQMHRVYFSPATMRKLLVDAGFTNVSIRVHIRYISLGYLWSRFVSTVQLPNWLRGIIIPFYIGDLFDVYAQKI